MGYDLWLMGFREVRAGRQGSEKQIIEFQADEGTRARQRGAVAVLFADLEFGGNALLVCTRHLQRMFYFFTRFQY